MMELPARSSFRRLADAGGADAHQKNKLLFMFYITYVLKSLKNDKLYIGWTMDMIQRFKKHSERKVKATKSGIPWKIVYYEARINKKKAIEREKALKTGFGRNYIKKNI